MVENRYGYPENVIPKNHRRVVVGVVSGANECDELGGGGTDGFGL